MLIIYVYTMEKVNKNILEIIFQILRFMTITWDYENLWCD